MAGAQWVQDSPQWIQTTPQWVQAPEVDTTPNDTRLRGVPLDGDFGADIWPVILYPRAPVRRMRKLQPIRPQKVPTLPSRNVPRILRPR